MLNIELILNLYECLTPEKKEMLRKELFGNSHQTMAYFKRSKDIKLSKLETLADFYHVNWEFFRIDNSPKTPLLKNCHGGSRSREDVLLDENRILRQHVRELEQEKQTLLKLIA